ncbi:MAG: iron complex transport system ATP-binding protein [Planctomycetota bacterium]|jgi:iron complex transport system ATP-binding protein
MVNKLQASGLSYSFSADKRVVSDIDVSVAPGEMMCVLGPNGAGKTTLLKLLAGLLIPDQGDVQLDGTSVAKLSDRDRARRIAVVPQYLGLVPEVTVADFVLSGRYVHFGSWSAPSGSDREVVRECLERTGVLDLEERGLWQISGGQRQRVIIARALAQGARYLLVDEPTGSLDPDQQLQIFNLLADLSDKDHAVLVVTHELNLASQFASSILLMQAGKNVAQGSPLEVLTAETLEPVYGHHLHFGSLPRPGGKGERPFVIPWSQGESV